MSEEQKRDSLVMQTALRSSCRCTSTPAACLGEALVRGCARCYAQHIEEVLREQSGETHVVVAMRRCSNDVISCLLAARQNEIDKTDEKVAGGALSNRIPMTQSPFWGVLTAEYTERLQKALGISCKCRRKATSLTAAVGQNCIKCCAQFIGQAGILTDNKTALMRAVGNKNTEIASLLLHLEARICTETGKTALFLAGVENFKQGVQLLLPCEAGLQDIFGTTALMAAAALGHLEAVQVLQSAEARIQDRAGRTALMAAAHAGHLDIARLLAPKEATIQAKDGTTALIAAATMGHVNVIKLLIPLEARLCKDHRQTALMSAVMHGQKKAAQCLLRHENDIQTTYGYKAADFAAVVRSKELWALFPGEITTEYAAILEKMHGAMCVCGLKSTSLWLAAQNGCLACCRRYMAQRGKLIDGTTALMQAATHNKADIVELLAFGEAGLRDPQGRTARILALEAGALDAAEILTRFEPEIEQ